MELDLSATEPGTFEVIVRTVEGGQTQSATIEFFGDSQIFHDLSNVMDSTYPEGLCHALSFSQVDLDPAHARRMFES